MFAVGGVRGRGEALPADDVGACVACPTLKTNPRAGWKPPRCFPCLLHVPRHQVYIPCVCPGRGFMQVVPLFRVACAGRLGQHDQLRQVDDDGIRVAAQCRHVCLQLSFGALVIAYRDDSCIRFHAPSLHASAASCHYFAPFACAARPPPLRLWGVHHVRTLIPPLPRPVFCASMETPSAHA